MNNPEIGHGETSEPGSGSENNCQSVIPPPLRPLPPENKHWRLRQHRGGTDLLAHCLHSLSMTSDRSGSRTAFPIAGLILITALVEFEVNLELPLGD